MGWEGYWREVCAPRLREQKKALEDAGQTITQEELASFVEANTRKRSTRALAGHWISGTREPYISQFIALCTKLRIDPMTVLSAAPTAQRQPAIRGDEKKIMYRKPYTQEVKKSQRKTRG